MPPDGGAKVKVRVREIGAAIDILFNVKWQPKVFFRKLKCIMYI